MKKTILTLFISLNIGCSTYNPKCVQRNIPNDYCNDFIENKIMLRCYDYNRKLKYCRYVNNKGQKLTNLFVCNNNKNCDEIKDWLEKKR